MRLDEWQKYIESEFLEDKPSKQTTIFAPTATPVEGNTPKTEATDLKMSGDDSIIEKRNETTTMRLKRRRNLTSANVVTHFDVPPFPVSESGRNESMYALLRSQAPTESLVSDEMRDEESGISPFKTDFPLERNESSLYESFDELRTSGHEAVVRVQNRPHDIGNEGSSVGFPVTISSKSVSEMPSIDRYLPGMSALASHDAVLGLSKEAFEEKTPPRTGRQFQATLNLETNRDELTSAKSVQAHLPVLHVLNRLNQEDALRPIHSQTLKGDRLATLERLLNPELTLDETALLLDISATTVRRYTNQGILKHFRKGMEGADSEEMNSFKTRQRRFRLLDVLEFFEERLKK